MGNEYREAPELKGNRTTIYDLQEHLRRAFEDFVNTYHAEVPYLDAFMGVHNFHKLIIQDIAHRNHMRGLAKAGFFKMSADTFSKAVELMCAKALSEGGS